MKRNRLSTPRQVRALILCALFFASPAAATPHELLSADFFGNSDQAVLQHNDRGELLIVGSQKILFMTEDLSLGTLTERTLWSPESPPLFSGGLTTHSSEPRFWNDFPLWQQARGEKDPQTPHNSSPIAGWVCHPHGILTIFRPANATWAGNTKELGLGDLSWPEGWPTHANTSLQSCVINAQNDLILQFQVGGASLLLNARTLTFRNVPEPHFRAVGPFARGVLIVNKHSGQYEVWTDNMELHYQGELPFAGEPDSLNSGHIVSRGSRILAAHAGQVWLLQTPSTPHAAFPLELERVSLPIAPCSEEQGAGCGLSLGHDGSWGVSGFWATVVGQGRKVHRVPLQNFSERGLPVRFSHQRLGGKFAVFGRDDGDLGQLPPHFAKASAVNEAVSSLSAQSVVWLKPGEALEAEEKLLFVNRHGNKVVSGVSQFNPHRHLMAENPQELSPLLQPPTQPPANGDSEAPWWKAALDLDAAWTIAEGTGVRPHSTRIAVLDSGADFNHPLFDPQPPQGELLGDGEDNDGNGYIDDHFGFDFVDEDTHPQDVFGHGTHVSGLARPAHPLFQSLQLITVRVLDSRGRSNTIDIGRGFLYAADRGAEIINASWGGGARTQFMEESLQYAQDRGALVITSAGNDGLNTDRNPTVPGAFPGVLSVGAHTHQFRRASFSNSGLLSVVAFMPGQNISSLDLNGGLIEKSGTSMAAPLYSAAFAALGSFWKAQNEGSEANWQDAVLGALCAHPRREARARPSQCGVPHLPQSLNSLLAD